MFVGACSSSSSKPKITVGAVLSQSGDCASGVDEIVEAANLAIEEINAAGGELGSELQLIIRDDRSNEDRSRSARSPAD